MIRAINTIHYITSSLLYIKSKAAIDSIVCFRYSFSFVITEASWKIRAEVSFWLLLLLLLFIIK